MLKTAITENKTQFADDLRDQLTQHASDVWEQFKQDNKLTDLPGQYNLILSQRLLTMS